MANPLLDIPGYGGYVAARQVGEARERGNLEQAGAVLSLRAALQKVGEEDAFRRELAALGPEPKTDAVMNIAAKYSDPKSLLSLHMEAANRKEATKERALQFAQNLDVRQQQLDLQREQFLQRTQDAQARQQFEQAYKTESLRNQQAAQQLNAQLRAMGFEIQRQGQQLQIQRFDEQRAQREEQQRRQEEQQIEGQIGKTTDRLKEVIPVYTAAQQLNRSLERFTPETIPGLGYAKNTDLGKVFLTPEGKRVSSDVKQFGNFMLKLLSGAAVTAPEEIRQMAAQMADGRFSAQDFYISWPKMAEWLNNQVALDTAGLTPKARERFIERTGLRLEPIVPRFDFQDGKLLDRKPQAAAAGPAAPAVPPPPPGFKVNN